MTWRDMTWQHRALLTGFVVCCILVAMLASAAAQAPVEAEKVEALKLGYTLNGNSMSRQGSLDVSGMSSRNWVPPPAGQPNVIRTIPITSAAKAPPEAAAAEEPPDVFPVVKKAAADTCTRHGKRKVVTDGGKSWRCR